MSVRPRGGIAQTPTEGERADKIAAEYVGGASTKDLARTHGISEPAVRRILDARKITVRTGAEQIRVAAEKAWAAKAAAPPAVGPAEVVAVKLDPSPARRRRPWRSPALPEPARVSITPRHFLGTARTATTPPAPRTPHRPFLLTGAQRTSSCHSPNALFSRPVTTG